MRVKCAGSSTYTNVRNTLTIRGGQVLIGIWLALALGSISRAQVGKVGHDIRKTEDGIPFVSAGVGKDSRENLPQFSLKLVFSTRTARYLANIETEIAPASGGRATRILSIGPWLLVDLPPGKFTVKARTTKGQEVTKTFQIAKGRITRVNLIWNISDEDI